MGWNGLNKEARLERLSKLREIVDALKEVGYGDRDERRYIIKKYGGKFFYENMREIYGLLIGAGLPYLLPLPIAANLVPTIVIQSSLEGRVFMGLVNGLAVSACIIFPIIYGVKMTEESKGYYLEKVIKTAEANRQYKKTGILPEGTENLGLDKI